MSNKKSDSSEKFGYQPSKSDSSPVKGGYAPTPTSERAPAPPPKNP
jgi:hypothetical protein